jgi:L-amino acid N-acyltransferase YncA
MTTDAERRQRQAKFVRDRYPRSGSLRGGRGFQIRLMERADRDTVLSFARALPADDLLYLRFDLTNATTVDAWLADIEVLRVFTILAWEDGELIGEASLLQSGADWTRHRGDIRMIVGPAARGEGLGHFLAEEIFVIAELLGLSKLAAEMSHDQLGAQSVFRGLGFEPVALLPGFVVDREGRERDLLVMAYDVTARGAPSSAQQNPKVVGGS